MCFGGNGLVTIAEQEVPSGLAALIIGVVPLWVVTMRMAEGDRVPASTLAGVALGFAGLAVLVLPGDAPLWGVLLIVAASISWAAVGTVAIVASVAAVVRRESGPAIAGEAIPARKRLPWRRRG